MERVERGKPLPPLVHAVFDTFGRQCMAQPRLRFNPEIYNVPLVEDFAEIASATSAPTPLGIMLRVDSRNMHARARSLARNQLAIA